MCEGLIDECLICNEKFTSTSNHRIASLKCGHIFGKCCIERWFNQNQSQGRCPKCNQASDLSDIRIIYGNTIVSIDKDVQKLKVELEKERKMRKNYEKQVEDMKFDLACKDSKIFWLMSQMDSKYSESVVNDEQFIKSNDINKTTSKSSMNSKQPFTHLQTIDLLASGCKMAIVADTIGFIVVTQPTSPQLSPTERGFGIRCINLHDFDSSEFIFLHTQQIKSMSMHPFDALLLTASLDKSVKLVDLVTKVQKAAFNLNVEPRCVAWNRSQTNLFFVGLIDGYLLECCSFSKKILRRINTRLTDRPINLIRYLNHCSASKLDRLFMTSNKNAYFCVIKSYSESSSASYEDTVVSIKHMVFNRSEIIDTNLSDDDSNTLILKVKSSDRIKLEYLVYNFNATDEIEFDLVKRFECGFESGSENSLKPKLFAHPSKRNSFLLCSGDDEGVLVFEKESTEPIKKFNSLNIISDIAFYKGFPQSKGPILALLTSKYLQLYKWSD